MFNVFINAGPRQRWRVRGMRLCRSQKESMRTHLVTRRVNPLRERNAPDEGGQEITVVESQTKLRAQRERSSGDRFTAFHTK